MDKVLRRVHTPDFKTQVVLAILRGDKTRLEVCSQFGIHPTQADKWKNKVLNGLPTLFTEGKNDLLKERDKMILLVASYEVSCHSERPACRQAGTKNLALALR